MTQLSPLLRWLLTAVATTIGGLGAAFAAYDVVIPPGLGIALAVLSMLFNALNLVPPQVGGTQQGLVSPGVTEPPQAQIDEVPPPHY